MQQISSSQASPEFPINENFQTLQHQAVYGRNHPLTTGLTWGYYGGRWGGFVVADGSVALTASATNHIVVKLDDGSVSVATASTNWDDAANYARVYKITTDASAVTAVEDHRAGPGGVHGGGGAAMPALAAVATSGSYNDLLDRPPNITVDSTAPDSPSVNDLWIW